jgi:hypothetical protein
VLITPLSKRGIAVDIYVSTWNDDGDRHTGTWGKNINTGNIEKILQLNPVIFEIEQHKRSLFTQKYIAKDIHKYSQTETYGDAVSMWYKIYKAFQSMERYSYDNNINYDLVIRHRSDILFTSELDIDLMIKATTDNILYTPQSHGRYLDVTYNMMDHFFFGRFNIMKIICSTYLYSSIEHIIHVKYISAEGLMKNNIVTHNIINKTFVCHYNVARYNGIEHVV